MVDFRGGGRDKSEREVESAMARRELSSTLKNLKVKNLKGTLSFTLNFITCL